MVYKLDLTGPGGNRTIIAKSGDNITVDLEPGKWNIAIEAYYFNQADFDGLTGDSAFWIGDEDPAGIGDTETTVKPGRHNDVKIPIKVTGNLPYDVIVTTESSAKGFDNLAAALDSINDGNKYTIMMLEDQNLTPRILDNNKQITLVSMFGGEIEIKLSGQGSLFTVGSNSELTLGEGITLVGLNEEDDLINNNAALVIVEGELTMLEGSKITGNKNDFPMSTGTGGGVLVGNVGKFIMKGGTISGNTADNYGGGVFVRGDGEVIMDDGYIANNTAGFAGGGVAISGEATLLMKGGTISGNTAVNGGGVYMSEPYSVTFTMSGKARVVPGEDSNRNEVYITNSVDYITVGELTDFSDDEEKVATIRLSIWGGYVQDRTVLVNAEGGDYVSLYYNRFTVVPNDPDEYIIDENGLLQVDQ
jgi:hypothetical protein